MAQVSPLSPRPPSAAATLDRLPNVRLELRCGSTRPIVHEVTDLGYLIGSVPGCDFRVPGADLPPVLCLITRHGGGVALRKLVATQPLFVNGRPFANGPLSHGDRVKLGSVEILVHVTAASAVPASERDSASREKAEGGNGSSFGQTSSNLAEEAGRLRQERQAFAAEQAARRQELETLTRQLDLRRQQVEEQTEELEADRVIWYQRRQEIEQECRQRAALLSSGKQNQQPTSGSDLEAREEQLARGQQELARLRQELAEIRRQLYDRYRERRDRLAGLQEAVDRAARKVQERKRQVDAEVEQIARDRQFLGERERVLTAREQKWQREDSEREATYKAREQKLTQERAALEKSQAQYQDDLARLERLQATVGQRQQQLQERARETDRRFEQLQRTGRELEEQARQLSEWHDRVRSEATLLSRHKADHDAAVAQVARLRQAQEAVAAKDKELEQRARVLDTITDKQAQEARQLRTECEQFREAQQRLAADRQTLGEREANLSQAEQARAALQEQLRRRAEELAARQRSLAEQTRKQDDFIAALEARLAEVLRERQQAGQQQASFREELQDRSAEVERQHTDLARREQRLRDHALQLKQTGRKLGAARKALREERVHWLAEQQEDRKAMVQRSAELDMARSGVLELQQQLPELTLQARAAAERLAQTREQLREHLRELHAHADQSHEAVDMLRSQVQVEAGQVREQQQVLHRVREEHRLAVAAFRQQLIEWQGQLTEMKQALAHGETRVDRRQAQVDQQARQIAATSTRLARQAEQLQAKEHVVPERRQEIERHVDAMREWYRRKLRELSLVRCPPVAAEGDAETTDFGQEPSRRAILALRRQVEPEDHKLGELLLSLNLVDGHTLAVLLDEAGRQRRSLRQALLAGGYLTLYQLALIETGNLDGLVLGPLRVVDRLRVTPCEAVYRIFDPRRNQEAVLRYLAEAEMEDAVHADEFRQGFAQAATLRHPQLAATLEVVEINGRPGVLQEWVAGLPSSDWPGLAAVPGVWFRLLSQAAHGLHAAHQAGMIHGHLQPQSFVLNSAGILKLCGLGEPSWLHVPPTRREKGSVNGDLADLGRIAAGWAAQAAHRKGTKGRVLPKMLQTILERLTAAEAELRYPSAAVLLAELEQVAAGVPAHSEAWERLLQQVRTEAAEDTTLRQSA